MSGVIVNTVAILIGGTIGLFLQKGLSETIKKVIMQGIGLSVVVIGISGALETNNFLLVVMSLAIGGLIGAALKIEVRLDHLGQKIEQSFKSENRFAKGFVWATLIYCVGAMAIVGSLEAGLEGSNTTLYIKSMLDGITAIIFTATLGFGVLFASIPVFLYQGSIVLLGNAIEPYLTDVMITEMSAVGSVLIMGIGINILEIKRIHVGDMLPSILVPVIYLLIQGIF